ncbi:MAG: OsmC family protein [Mariniphaga sp.]
MSNLLNFSTCGVNESATKFIASSRTFNFIVDEPPALGGTDHGANPVEYILAGFAGCLNVVAHIVAREQGINLRSLKISVEGDINPARLLGVSYEARAGFQSLRINLIPDTDATPEALSKWLKEVEERCPVRDNLANITPLQIGIKDFVAA